MTPQLEEGIYEVREKWSQVTYDDVLGQMQDVQMIEPTETTSRAAILTPEGNDFDEDQSVVLALPHLQGWIPHHYIRARVMQQLIAPDKRVIVMPNNTIRQQNYDLSALSTDECEKMSRGDILPLADRQMRTLESIDKLKSFGTLGRVSLTGYSLGANIVLGMASAESNSIEVDRVNADEAVSDNLRTAASDVQSDFMKSGGALDPWHAKQASKIPALSSALRSNRMAWDWIRFGVMNFTPHGKLMRGAMTSSINLLLSDDIPTKIGHIENSKMFNPSSIVHLGRNVIDVVRYEGEGFRGHPSADDVFVHALMVNDGLKLANR